MINCYFCDRLLLLYLINNNKVEECSYKWIFSLSNMDTHTRVHGRMWILPQYIIYMNCLFQSQSSPSSSKNTRGFPNKSSEAGGGGGVSLVWPCFSGVRNNVNHILLQIPNRLFFQRSKRDFLLYDSYLRRKSKSCVER